MKFNFNKEIRMLYLRETVKNSCTLYADAKSAPPIGLNRSHSINLISHLIFYLIFYINFVLRYVIPHYTPKVYLIYEFLKTPVCMSKFLATVSF